jgi:hypothetical protein
MGFVMYGILPPKPSCHALREIYPTTEYYQSYESVR